MYIGWTAAISPSTTTSYTGTTTATIWRMGMMLVPTTSSGSGLHHLCKEQDQDTKGGCEAVIGECAGYDTARGGGAAHSGHVIDVRVVGVGGVCVGSVVVGCGGVGYVVVGLDWEHYETCEDCDDNPLVEQCSSLFSHRSRHSHSTTTTTIPTHHPTSSHSSIIRRIPRIPSIILWIK